jgi:DNA helicase-2/ATP-dependent DNA helicase PcrA
MREDPLLREQLDAEQYDIASHLDGNLVVLAPPGSGKTRVLVNAAAHRARHAEAIVGYRHARVMCLTFGTDAAREMHNRLRSAPLFVPSNRILVRNYHGLCMLLLSRYGHLIGWPRDAALVPSPQNDKLISQAIADLGIRSLTARGVSGAISALKGRRQDSTSDGSATLVAVRERYDEILAERFLRDFDDLILHTVTLLDQNPAVKQVIYDAYPFVFVDELQDTNLLQLDLLDQLIGPNTRVFAVADDDQMIYGWRDAHPGNISHFLERFNAEERFLTGNYRCPPRIVEAANAVIVHNDRRRDHVMESRVADREGEVFVIAGQSLSDGEIVAQEVERARRDGVPLGEIAVLAPHKFKFDDVLEAFDQHGIRWVHPGGDKLAENPTVALLRLSLRASAGGTIAAADVAELGVQGDDEAVAVAIAEVAAGAGSGPPRGLLSQLLTGFELGTVRDPARDPDAIRVLATMFRKAVDDERPADAPELAAAILLHWDRLEAAALRAEQAVKVMTSFTAKGTEYRVVILPFMNADLVPYAPRGREVDWEEARRLFYVALTRAENRVVLVYDAHRATSQLLEYVAPHATWTEER